MAEFSATSPRRRFLLEHGWQHRVLEPVGKMLGLDQEVEGASDAKGYLPHGLPSKGRGGDHHGPAVRPVDPLPCRQWKLQNINISESMLSPSLPISLHASTSPSAAGR